MEYIQITSQLPGIAPDMDLIQIATQPQLPANTIIDASHLAAVTVPVSLATTPVSVASTVPQCQHNGQDGHTHQLENGETKGTNLIVNYLPQTMSQEEIRSLFASIGDVESCKLIRDKVTGQSLGYGFVNYKNPTDAQKAINTLCGLRLQNKTIKVSQARPSCEGIKGANVYVCGLPKTFTQLDLESVFGQYGTIISSRILYDQITGLSKGVGFIRFDMRSEAEKAIDQLNGVIPKNATEKITVKFANNPSSKNPTLPLTIPATPYMSPMKKIVGPIHAPGRCFRFSPFEGAILANPLLAPTTAAAAAAAASTSSLLNSSANTGWCLFVYNLPPETEDNILWQLFGPIGAVQNVKVIRDLATQKCKGFGFVTMTNYEDACQAITTFNGYQLGERQLQVSFKSQTRKP